MFIYCHDCGWSQDDFWSENYYPTTDVITRVLLPGILDPTKRELKLTREEAHILEFPYPESEEDEVEEIDAEGRIKVDFRAYVGYELMRVAKRIMQQFWVTEKDYEDDITKRCPICNSTDLGVD